MCFRWIRSQEKITMATAKGLSIICKFQNLANTYLGKSPSFQLLAFAFLPFWSSEALNGFYVEGKLNPPPPQCL